MASASSRRMTTVFARSFPFVCVREATSWAVYAVECEIVTYLMLLASRNSFNCLTGTIHLRDSVCRALDRKRLFARAPPHRLTDAPGSILHPAGGGWCVSLPPSPLPPFSPSLPSLRLQSRFKC